MKCLILALFVVAATARPLEDNSGPVELIVNGVPEGQPLELGDILDIKVKEHSQGQVVATNLLYPLTAAGIADAIASDASDNAPVNVVDAPEVTIPEAVVLPAPAMPEVVGIVPQPVVLPAPASPEVVGIVPQPVVLPAPASPEVVGINSNPIVLPAPASPEVVGIVPQPVVLPAPATPEVVGVIPEPVVLPAPASPEVVGVIPEPVVLPSPAIPEVVPEPVGLPSPIAPVVVPEPATLPSGEIFNDGSVSITLNTPQEAGVLTTIQSWFGFVLNYFNNGVQTTQQVV